VEFINGVFLFFGCLIVGLCVSLEPRELGCETISRGATIEADP
jgi:hypothetical protein